MAELRNAEDQQVALLALARAPRAVLAAAVICAAALCASILAAPALAERGFETGLYEPDYTSSDASTQTLAFDRSAQARAGFTLIAVDWSSVAPNSKPLGFVPSNPGDTNYKWGPIDAAVRDASARGLRVLLTVTRAPSWAEGPGRPSPDEAPPGTWRPDPGELGDFTRAIATRYSGHFAGLPAVRYWQLWAEPNLAVNLGPQFDGNTPVGFNVYRPMLNAFYTNLKAVSPQNQVMTGGTAPYGNLTPASGLTYQRMQPLDFWRGLLCLRIGKKGKKHRAGKLIRVAGCTPPRFDIAAHHPINVGSPTRHALNADDASTPDIGKVRRVIRAGVGKRPIWATEIWWNSNPPSRGVSLKTQARYLSQSFYVLWKQRVPVTFWFELRDLQPNGIDPIPTSGLLFRDGRPKPAFQAFRFPFAAERLSKTRVRVWGLAPGAGPVQIGIGKGKHLHRIRTLKAGVNRVFVGIIHVRHGARLRAVQGSEGSLVWRQS
jgi:hypothetical protein